MRTTPFLLMGVLVIACSAKETAPTGAPGPHTGTTAPPPGAPVGPIAPEGLVAQEWGTYTSVHASDGHVLGGVHHEDEALPSWVYRRNLADQTGYYLETLPEEPKQQLETPVLYFWSKDVKRVGVSVGFPQGIVGQWFPQSKASTPDQITAIANGSMTWDVEVDPAIEPSAFRAVKPDEIWAPSRNVASAPVHWRSPAADADEREQFIFYRGLGMFDPPVAVSIDDQEQLHVRNDSADDLGAVFVLRVTPTGGDIVNLGALPAHQTKDSAAPAPSLALETYAAKARVELAKALVASGLYGDVAQAMVDTWTRSWFKNVGLRVLYLAPRAWTDAWLPLTITPTPTSLVRTLVGRMELLTKAEEKTLTDRVHAYATSGAPFDLTSLGRFAEPRLLRALEQITSPSDKTLAESWRTDAHAKP